MHYFNCILLIISIIVFIHILECQSFEDKIEKNDNVLLKQNDLSSYVSNNIGQKDSISNFISEYSENKIQKKRQASRSSKKSSKSKKIPSKFVKLKFKVYKDINNLRKKYFIPPLKTSANLAKKVQEYAELFVKADKKWKPYRGIYDELHYYCKKIDECDPIKFWSRDEDLLTLENIENDLIDLDYTRLLWRSTKTIGCGVYGDKHGIRVFCRMYPKGNIKGKYKENIDGLGKK